MAQKFLLTFLLWIGFIIPNIIHGQTEKSMASQFAVHIFSSANYMGYLEPCG